jgi:parvulin-like peptidyl-prolyl isomerase
MTLLLVSMILIPPVLAQDEAAQSNNEMIPYETPLARYGDRELSLGYFFTYAMDYLGRLDRMAPEEKQELFKSTLARVFFEHAIVDLAMEQGYGQTEEYLRRKRDMENDWLSRFYVYHQFTRPFQADEEELKALYEKEREKYYKPLSFSFRHIFLKTVDLPEEQQKLAKERAEQALALIRSGSDFVEIARDYSDSEKKGTVVGPFKSRKDDPDKAINPQLEDVLLTMNPGDVSDLVQTKYGYEILKLESLTPAEYTTFESVKATLTENLRREKFEQWRSDLLNKYWDEAVVEFHPDMIFEANASPDAEIAALYGYSQTINIDDYGYLKGRNARRQPGESDEDFRTRQIEDFKELIIFNVIAGRLARELRYDAIPRYIDITDSTKVKKCYAIWWNKITSKYLEDHPITAEEKQRFYEEHQNSFLKPVQKHIAEMSFQIPPHNTDVMYEVFKAEEAAQKKAEQAIARVKAGEKFADVAKEMSESPTAANGGDVGFIDANTDVLPRMVARDALNLATETVCEKPIKANDRFYVVYNHENAEREKLEFNDSSVQTRIERAIQNQKSTEVYQEYMNKMVDADKIELLFENFYTFELRNLGPSSLDVPDK